MIVKTSRQTTFHLLLSMQGSIIPAIAHKILFATILGVIAKFVYDGKFGDDVEAAMTFSFSPFTALGVAISLFLGFHNNASYGRWWEARQIWGTQVVAMRNMIRFFLGVLDVSDDDINITEEVDKSAIDGDVEEAVSSEDESMARNWREKIILLAVAQTHALRSQLRPSCKSDTPLTALQDRNRFLDASDLIIVDNAPNPGNAILLHASRILGRSPLTEYNMIQGIFLIDQLAEIQAKCERIHNTSLPFAYSLLVHRTAFFYVVLAPFAMVDTMGWWTPLFTAILAYTFFGFDELARQIQEPFQDEPHCLALSAMCRSVEIDVCEALKRKIPYPLEPINSVLM